MTARPPWPIVAECHGRAPSRVAQGHSCAQCDGSHDHQWVAWHEAPRTGSDSGSTVVGKSSGPGIPVRCKVCGARKCDQPDCRLRRHHAEDHEAY